MKTRIGSAAIALVMMLACVSRADTAAPAVARDGKKARASAAKSWVTESNVYAIELLSIIGQFEPEDASFFGLEAFDGGTLDLKPQFSERYAKALTDEAALLDAAAGKVADPRVKLDLKILSEAARAQSQTITLERRYLLPYLDLGELLFQNFHSIVDSRVPKARQAAALVRLRKYIGREPGYEPLTTLARADYEAEAKNPALLAPWVVDVQQDLDKRASMIDGLRDLFAKSSVTGWQSDLDTLTRQLNEYSEWVRTAVLPHARKSNLLPPEIYADRLKQSGVRMDPPELIDRALASFMQTRDEMQSIARVVADKRGYTDPSYQAVIRELKKEKIPADKLLAVYTDRLHAIERIARDQKLITLPKRNAVIRLATPAEEATAQAPHVSLPRFLGNTGEPAEFVLTTKNPNATTGAELDDFNYDAVTWALTAHEARPGHELQYAKMMEDGVSIARVVFAFSSANVEGWGLYSEAIMRAYLPPEGQLCLLQLRLMRAARAFLDPMVNLGMIEPDAVKRLLMDEVRLSEPMAKQEVDRYTFNMPGQAPAYFYGYTKLSSLRTKLEIRLGPSFSPLAFHDSVVSAGILPFDLLETLVTEKLVPAKPAAAPTGTH